MTMIAPANVSAALVGASDFGRLYLSFDTVVVKISANIFALSVVIITIGLVISIDYIPALSAGDWF